jgi:hypothetical protein
LSPKYKGKGIERQPLNKVAALRGKNFCSARFGVLKAHSTVRRDIGGLISSLPNFDQSTINYRLTENSDINPVDSHESVLDLGHVRCLSSRLVFSSLGSRESALRSRWQLRLLLDFKSSRLYSPENLVFGKAVKVRHYPVTVST